MSSVLHNNVEQNNKKLNAEVIAELSETFDKAIEESDGNPMNTMLIFLRLLIPNNNRSNMNENPN